MSAKGLRIGALVAAFAVLAVLPAAAGAEPRRIVITFAGGKSLTLTLDVPAGTPLSQIHLPPLTLPIVSVTEAGSPPGEQAATPGPPKPDGPAESKRARPTASRHHATRRHRHAAAHSRSSAKPAARAAAPPVDLPPAAADPKFNFELPGPAPAGVPNFFIDKFRIPPFLLSIYQAAGTQYGIPWQVLAAINEIETDYGRNLATSSAGAMGWMQFLPATWSQYGVDANGDGTNDPYNPVDAIFSAARYLQAAGGGHDLRGAVFAYNHAGWYVDSVMMRARLIAGMPARLVGSLTGLTEGRFPVAAVSRYVTGSRRGLNIYSRAGAAAVAVQDAKIVAHGYGTRLGRFVRIRDAYGNAYTYGNLAKIAAHRRRSVAGGTVLGRIGTRTAGAPHLRFEVRPAGKGAPRIDPKPLLDGWKLLEATAIYRSTHQVLLMSKQRLQRRVLRDDRITADRRERRFIAHGNADRRLLATLAWLATTGMHFDISHLKGAAVDIAGADAAATSARLKRLQGTLKPLHVTLAKDVHVSFSRSAFAVRSLRWTRLIDRISHIDNPVLEPLER